MDIKNVFSKIGAKKIYLTLGGVFLVAIVAGAMFLPGALFRGEVPTPGIPEIDLKCKAVPNPAFKGNEVKWIAEIKKSSQDDFSVVDSEDSVHWTGDVGENGAPIEPEENITIGSKKMGSSITVTYPEDYENNKASAKATFITSSYYHFPAECEVELLDPIVIPPPETKKVVIDHPETDSNKIAIPSKTEDTAKLPSSPSKSQYSLRCSPNVSKTETGKSVEWKAVLHPAVKGVEYTWVGNGIKTRKNDTGTLEIRYSTAGEKSASVTVSKGKGSSVLDPGTSGTLTMDCGTVTVVEAPPAPDPLAVACSVATDTIESGDTVTWTANASGGEDDYSYLWTGDKIDDKTTKSVQAVFTQKPQSDSFKVRVDSGTESETVTCPQLTYVESTQEQEEDKTEETDAEEGDAEETDAEEADAEEADAEETDAEEADAEEADAEDLEEEDTGELSKCPGVYYPSDIEGHWAEDYIKRGYDYCLFKGVGGKFFPDRNATRIEAASMILYSKDKQPSQTCTTLACLTPFNDLQYEEQGAILNPLYFESLIEGYPNNQFRPQTLITRAEVASLIVRAFFEPFGRECYDPHCGAGWPDNFFIDITETWQGRYIRVLWDLRIMTGSGPNRVDPNRSITRAEMAKMIVLAYEETH